MNKWWELNYILLYVNKFHTCQLSRIQHWSPALPYGSPYMYLPDKIIFWAFQCLSLRFRTFWLKTWIFLICSTVSGAFLHIFPHWQRLFLASNRWLRLLIAIPIGGWVNLSGCEGWGSVDIPGGKVVKKKRVSRF